MHIDSLNLYSDEQALTATAASTNIVDHGSDRDLGKGEPMMAVILVDVALEDDDADETYVAVLQTDTVAAFSSPTTLASFSTMTRADAAGTRYFAQLPPNTVCQRFTRVYYTLGGTTPTATVTSWLGPQSMYQSDGVYPDNITITT